jgi:Lon protease-like protein
VALLILPIFPLPDITFFPGTVLPLHVFEARYRAMVVDALQKRPAWLAIVAFKPGFEADYAGKPAVREVCGAGQIAGSERLPTGRFNIVLRGECRIRIVTELPTDTLYRVVRAERLEDLPATTDTTPMLGRVRASCRRLLETLGRPSDLLDAALADDQPPGVVADRIASAVLPNVALRQELLETLDVGERLTRLATGLDALVAELRGGRE